MTGNKADELISEARELQMLLNGALDQLTDLGVICHSVCSYHGYGNHQFGPLPVQRVALVLEMKSQE